MPKRNPLFLALPSFRRLRAALKGPRRRILVLASLVFSSAFCIAPVLAKSPGADSIDAPHIRVSLLSEHAYLLPGRQQQFALRLEPEQGWHTYWINPGDSGKATALSWQLPRGIRAGALQWPVPERIPFGGGSSFGYHGDTWLLADLAMPSRAVLQEIAVQDPGGTVSIAAQASWLVCREVCLQGNAMLRLALPLVPEGAESKLDTVTPMPDGFARARAALPQQLQGAPAQYSIEDGQLVASIDAAELPVFSRQPEVFIAVTGLLQTAARPSVAATRQGLRISAPVGVALAEPPPFLPMLLQFQGAAGVTTVALLARFEEPAFAGTETASTEARVPLVDNGVAAVGKDISLVYVLMLALLGGLVLNAMPCVFPVLSLKVISLVEHGGYDRRDRQLHGLAYTAGVVASFLLVAAVLIALRATGEQIGWGFQLQAPAFVALLVYVLFLLGLSLSGMVEIGTSLQNIGNDSVAGSSPLRASFLTGVLATVVATPCTAPFMGTAMGFALTQPLAVALLTFAVLGLGLALPFLLIAFVPALASWLPAAGNWMVSFKEFLAFPIYLTVVWLLWVFARQAGIDAAAALLIGMVLLAMALWLRRATMFSLRARAGALAALLSALLALLSLLWALQLRVALPAPGGGSSNAGEFVQPGAVAWSQQRLDAALAAGKTVFVNMTADWCITCKVNERVALSREAVKRALARPEVEYLVGDWTNSDSAISLYLETFERNGVPLYVVYKPGESPRLLPQVLTQGIVLDALK
ncbi:MAG: thioredoxin family protein [Pseudomonadales bacterium]